jgi:hypothetical protein
MAVSALSLPIDIPWRRLCVSSDMLDRKLCDRKFPFRWRSSVAVFGYEPPPDQQSYEDQIVSYLKVVCTITGFQPDPTEVGLIDRRIDNGWNDPAVIENFKDVVAAYYGCYGAVLEVAIAARDPEISQEHGPYFVDFEPKKRELYEVVSDTGEVMSRSLENVNVRKGTTTSDAHEVLDIFGGFSQSFQYAGTGGSTSVQGQWGTRDLSQQEYQNVRTSDSAREQRETYSHTTQLTQMYHQLDSYHLGTNRAVFFMLPRPHIVQGDATFTNGPRLLEGVQEFFLVVARPKNVGEICVEAYLETAHIASEPQLVYEQSAATVNLHVQKILTEDRDCWNCYGDDSYFEDASDIVGYTPPVGGEIDLSRSGGFQDSSVSGTNIRTRGVRNVSAGYLELFGTVRAEFVDRTWPTPNEFRNGLLDMNVTVFIRKKKPEVSGYAQNLWLTGRGVCCCDHDHERDDVKMRDSVTFEKGLDTPWRGAIGAAQMKAQEANEMRLVIANQMRAAVNHPDRYAAGEVTFLDTQFVGRTIANIVRTPGHPDNLGIANLALDKKTASKITRIAPRISRGKLLEVSAAELSDRFDLSAEEVRTVRRAALGLAGEAPEGADKWTPPGYGGDTTVPDVVGLRLDAARTMIRAARLSADMVEYVDDPAPRGVVLKQEPEAGAEIPARSEVMLVLSTGASVQIPDLIGRGLAEAVCALRDAGLTSDPVIKYGKQSAKSRVVRVEPAPRSFVSPGATVTIELGTAKE